MIGRTFGRLTVIEEAPKRSNRKAFYCQCSCGNVHHVMQQSLKSGNTVSCGCIKKEYKGVPRKDYSYLIGQEFNYLTVLEVYEKVKYKPTKCSVSCVCGHVFDLAICKLNEQISCGCVSRQESAERFKEYQRKLKIENGEDPDILKTPEVRRIREDIRKLSKDILERDDYTCALCSARGGKLHAHHIEKFSHAPELRDNMNNMITLCKECHYVKAHDSNWRTGLNLEIQEQLREIMKNKAAV